MGDMKLGVIETRFAEIIWANAPLTTNQLIRLCAEKLEWKRTTTYTVLKKLCEKGIFKMEDSTVTVCISKDAFCAMQTEQFVSENFGGSLPAFVAAFTSRKKLSQEEMAEIRRMIDAFEEA